MQKHIYRITSFIQDKMNMKIIEEGKNTTLKIGKNLPFFVDRFNYLQINI